MQKNEQAEQQTTRLLAEIEKRYGFVPLVNTVLAERPDMFLPNNGLSRAVLEGEGALDRKTRYLIALSAAVALSGEHCMHNQLVHAIEAGASRDEVLEVMEISSYMAMTKCQSYAFREYAKEYNVDTKGQQ